MIRRIVGVVLASALVARGAQAETDRVKGFYFGGGYGYADFQIPAAKLERLGPGATFESNESFGHQVGGRAFLGYAFTRHLAVEIDWVEHGTYLAETVVPDETHLVRIHDRVETDGNALTLVGRLPLGKRFALLGRGGAFRECVIADRHETAHGAEVGDFHSHTESVRSTFGGGIEFGAGRGALRLEWHRYLQLGTSRSPFGRFDVDLLTTSALYRF